MELFYVSPDSVNADTLILDDFESKHLRNTLRKQAGDEIDLTDGCGYHYTGRIVKLKPYVSVEILSKNYTGHNDSQISLAVGFIKPNRLEFILEKGTELGVKDFYLFRSEHANYYSDNVKRFEKIIRQALKQSNHYYMPGVKLYENFTDFMHSALVFKNRIAAIDSTYPGLQNVIINKDEEYLFCVGPEGGFSPDETILLRKNKFDQVSLGKNRLRAETAALAGIAGLQILSGKFS